MSLNRRWRRCGTTLALLGLLLAALPMEMSMARVVTTAAASTGQPEGGFPLAVDAVDPPCHSEPGRPLASPHPTSAEAPASTAESGDCRHGPSGAGCHCVSVLAVIGDSGFRALPVRVDGPRSVLFTALPTLALQLPLRPPISLAR